MLKIINNQINKYILLYLYKKTNSKHVYKWQQNNEIYRREY